MNGIALFVERRVLAYMISAAIILFGIIGLRGIGVDRNPNVEPPVITVTTINPGASPEVMDSSISSLVESAINSISGVDKIQTDSMPSVSVVFVEFELSKSADIAFNEVQGKINQIVNDLPDEAEVPVVAKVDPNATPVAWLIIKGDRTLSELNQLARQQIKKSLENISGVGQVLVGGGRERKIRVDLDLARLSALGLTAQDVIAAFAREHVQIPGGFLVGGMLEKLLHLDLEYHSVAELGDLVVVWRDQVPVKLRDIATVNDGLDDKRSLARLDGEEGVAIAINKIQGANTVAIVREMERRLESTIRPQLPDGVELIIATNEADVVDGIVTALKEHIIEGILLAAFVVWLFLLNLPATVIISTAIPVSLAGAVVVMYFGGYTFNMLTMSGLLLLIGVVVDDAIVVLENVHRQYEQGVTDPVQAALQGTRGVVSAVFAASMTLVCIFATVIFMDGMVGVFMRSFAVVVTVGVLTSLLVSLSLTPALCARFLRPENSEAGRGVVTGKISQFHTGLESAYRWLLQACLQFRWTVLLCATLLVASSAWFVTQLGTEFFPEDDESRFLVKLEAPLGSSIDYMVDKIDQAERILRAHPEVKQVLSTVGSARGDEVNKASLKITMVERGQRQISQQAFLPMMRQELAAVAGVKAYVSVFPMFEAMGDSPFEAYITGPDLYEVARLSQQMLEQLSRREGFDGLRVGLKLNRPQLSFTIDRNRAQALGISTQQIGDTIRVLAGGADIAKFNELPGDGERYAVRLAAKREGMRDFRDLENVYLRGPGGELVQLSAVVDLQETLGPATISRLQLNFAAGFFATPTTDLGEAVSIFRGIAAEVLPAGYQVVLVGQADEMEKTGGSIIFLIVTGLILVYMVLASQFNSFLQPLLVMLAQPLAVVGGFVALWLTGDTLNLFSMIGMVLLVGLVSKNSILLVDLINQYRSQGLDTVPAIREACPRRMRPVLMTSLTIILAMLPAAVGAGEGSGQYGPLAVAVIGGVVSSTLLTLLVVPVAYSLLDRWLHDQAGS
ncbi:MAG: efflux RND transporter permease subunit [Gammaproteobacteria bacterium]|nr:efflux RND transporter permease subunit [Gammaproteobacteria bacterium]